MSFKENEQLYTIRDMCDMLKISRKTLNNWMDKGLPHYKIFGSTVRFNKQEVQTWLTEQKIERVKNSD